ncbi:hypothetical protein G6F62_011856 [Rhizopus arrhizus]|nr:hypothetical protein G6F62_011856 [Rhizopus arrhizus]
MLSWVERSHSRFMFTPLMDPNDIVGAGQSMDLHPYDADKKLVQPVNAVHNKTGGHKGDTKKNGLSPFEKTVLEKLERIENEVTLHKDRLDIHERKIQFMDSNGARSGRNTHNNHPFAAQCYNCKGYGHMARECRQPCGAGESGPIKNPNNVIILKNNERRQEHVNVITSMDSQSNVAMVNATGEGSGGSKSKKTPEEKRAVLLKNLEKARAAKAEYKRQDDEAKVRGEVPPSVMRKVRKDYPIMLDEEGKVRSMNMKNALWDIKIEVPFPQLMYHAPELQYECATLLGLVPGRKRAVMGKLADLMEVDDTNQDQHKQIGVSENPANVLMNNIKIDTTSKHQNPITLQSVITLIGESTVEFLVDGGAVVFTLIISLMSCEITQKILKINNLTVYHI